MGEIVVRSVDEAKKPETLQWVIQQIEAGVAKQEICKALGIPDVQSYLWRVIRKEVQSYYNPKSEVDALTEFYLDQAEKIETLEIQLKDIDARIKEGPHHKVVTVKGREIVIEDKTFHNLFKYRLDITKAILEERNRQFQNFLDHKKVKNGVGKYAGAKINIYSNVPRPVLEEAVKILGDDDE